MNYGIKPPRSLDLFAGPVLAIFDASVEAAQKAAREKRRSDARARRRGWQLQPGAGTPLWNQLLREVRVRLKRRGSQAQLARLLALPRQRLNRCLTAQAAMLDAERTLLLLGWLAAQQAGRPLETPPMGAL